MDIRTLWDKRYWQPIQENCHGRVLPYSCKFLVLVEANLLSPMVASFQKSRACRVALSHDSPTHSQNHPATARTQALPPHTPVRVLVVDDHPIVRAGIVDLLCNHDWLVVVGPAADGREAVAHAK